MTNDTQQELFESIRTNEIRYVPELFAIIVSNKIYHAPEVIRNLISAYDSINAERIYLAGEVERLREELRENRK